MKIGTIHKYSFHEYFSAAVSLQREPPAQGSLGMPRKGKRAGKWQKGRSSKRWLAFQAASSMMQISKHQAKNALLKTVSSDNSTVV